MTPETANRLVAHNRDFYDQFASSFAETRAQPQPGFEKLLAYLPKKKSKVLDLGCGEGRFGRFLSGRNTLGEYTGLDFNEELVRKAKDSVKGRFHVRSFHQEGWAVGLETYDVIACLAAFQHIPGANNRSILLKEISDLLTPGGRIFLSLWQFLGSERQRRKIVPWETIGLTENDVEEGDYLVSWDRNGKGMRYVCYIDPAGLEQLVTELGLVLLDSYRSDGKEGDLNLYAVIGLP